MTEADSRPILVTHGGKFHCDEVFAYAVLRLALGLSDAGRDHLLVRTRKPEEIEGGDIVWDVGATFDPAARRFDHHQRGAPVREDGTPFSSAGLVWQAFGQAAVAAILPPGLVQHAGTVAADIEDGIVRRIDEIDNGVGPGGVPVDPAAAKDMLSLASLIGDFNPPWNHSDASGPDAGNSQFAEAAMLAEGVIRRRVSLAAARLAAEADVLAAHAAGEDPRLLVLPRGMPWKNVVFTHALPVLFAVSPASNGNWMIDTMPPEPGSFAQRLPLPEAWAGLQGEALAAEAGVPDAVFVHLRRFVGAARTREGAVAMAQKALAAA